ncbi:hypothetical protein [Methylobacterium sp. J-068]|uniref:hypothetical protein n=1 Tax=Methylobacterium sp. J-068 TaxID=2836649 RepID=UPI001FBA30F4|nr:hypothetical protein [Methylobacterium sp. J-068]MCJ2035483.1 hypothetical protein [Methylobacterium sp. J-068]
MALQLPVLRQGREIRMASTIECRVEIDRKLALLEPDLSQQFAAAARSTFAGSVIDVMPMEVLWIREMLQIVMMMPIECRVECRFDSRSFTPISFGKH